MSQAGLPPIVANTSNAVAISPGHFLAAVADRARLPALDRRLGLRLAAAALGSGVGATILLVLPERLFILSAPALIAFATGLFAIAPMLQRRSARRRTSCSSNIRELLAILLASVYGGFFGGGLGVILTAVLSITDDDDLRTIKVQKNLLATVVSAVAVAIFVLQGAVRWPQTLVMMSGALAGRDMWADGLSASVQCG